MGGWPSKSTAATANSSGWSALPPELLDLILRRLSSLADRVHFTCVCHHWRAAVRDYSLPGLPYALPWLNFRNGNFRSLPDGELHAFRFREYAMCYGCFDNWLLFEQAGCRRPGRRHYLKNLILGATKRLPGRCKEPVQVKPDGAHGSSTSSSTDFHILKVVMCSRDLVAANVMYQHRLEAVVCCRPGVSSSWSAGLWNGHSYQDMALHKKKLYTVTEEGDLFGHEVTSDIDTDEPRVSGIEQVIQSSPQLVRTLDGPYAILKCTRRCYLVNSCTGKLLMVRWIVPDDSAIDMTFKVFEADLVMSRWLEVESLGDQVLFISSYCSRAVRASDHQEYMHGNHICFLDESSTLVHWAT